MFLLRLGLVFLLLPLIVVVDWGADQLVGTPGRHVVTALSIPAGIVGYMRLTAWDDDESDPLDAYRRQR